MRIIIVWMASSASFHRPFGPRTRTAFGQSWEHPAVLASCARSSMPQTLASPLAPNSLLRASGDTPDHSSYRLRLVAHFPSARPESGHPATDARLQLTPGQRMHCEAVHAVYSRSEDVGYPRSPGCQACRENRGDGWRSRHREAGIPICGRAESGFARRPR